MKFTNAIPDKIIHNLLEDKYLHLDLFKFNTIDIIKYKITVILKIIMIIINYSPEILEHLFFIIKTLFTILIFFRTISIHLNQIKLFNVPLNYRNLNKIYDKQCFVVYNTIQQ